MPNQKRLYTSAEILSILKEQHRLCSPLDHMADAKFVLERSTEIIDWMDALDLVPWKDLASWYNTVFHIDVPLSEWENVMTPETERTLGDLCDFLATVAEKEIVAPVKRMGSACQSAAIFLTLKRNLARKGVDVSELRPSTPIAPFLAEHFSPMIEEVTTTGVKTFDKLSFGPLETHSFFKYWIDRLLPNLIFRRPLLTGNIHTFRDLVECIMANEALAKSPRFDIFIHGIILLRRKSHIHQLWFGLTAQNSINSMATRSLNSRRSWWRAPARRLERH